MEEVVVAGGGDTAASEPSIEPKVTAEPRFFSKKSNRKKLS